MLSWAFVSPFVPGDTLKVEKGWQVWDKMFTLNLHSIITKQYINELTAPFNNIRTLNFNPANDLRVLLPSIIITVTSNSPQKYRNRQSGLKSANYSTRT